MKSNRRTFLKNAGAQVRSGAIPKNMTFLTISKNGEYSLGVKTDKGVLDVKAASRLLKKKVPTTIEDVIRGGDQGLTALVRIALRSDKSKKAFLDESKIHYGPCVTNPEKIVMLGLNYRKHCMETHAPIPTSPVLFSKTNNALNYHNGIIKLPTHVSTKFDYEVELVVVMGKTAWRVSEDEALSSCVRLLHRQRFQRPRLATKDEPVVAGKKFRRFCTDWTVLGDGRPDSRSQQPQTGMLCEW